jgi:hypothetical protein
VVIPLLTDVVFLSWLKWKKKNLDIFFLQLQWMSSRNFMPPHARYLIAVHRPAPQTHTAAVAVVSLGYPHCSFIYRFESSTSNVTVPRQPGSGFGYGEAHALPPRHASAKHGKLQHQ